MSREIRFPQIFLHLLNKDVHKTQLVDLELFIIIIINIFYWGRSPVHFIPNDFVCGGPYWFHSSKGPSPFYAFCATTVADDVWEEERHLWVSKYTTFVLVILILCLARRPRFHIHSIISGLLLCHMCLWTTALYRGTPMGHGLVDCGWLKREQINYMRNVESI